MPEKHLIEEIKEMNKKLTVLKAQTTENEKIKLSGYRNRGYIEKLNKDMEDLKREKEEVEKKREYLQKVVKLQGTLEKREGKTIQLKDRIEELEQENEQIEELIKEIADLNQKRDQLENEIIKLKSDIRELKKEIKEMKENHENHQNSMKDAIAKSEENINILRYEMSVKIRQLEDNHTREMDELNNFFENDVDKLKTEHSKMESKLNEYKKHVSYCTEENQHILYIGQLCSNLQTNWYRYVMPKRCHVEHRPYKVKDIIDDIDDRVLLSEEEQNDAKRRWKELQSKIDWKKNKRSIKAIKRIQHQRNQAAHPKVLSEEEAKSAAEELRKQGKLNVKPSFEDVIELINLWKSSISLH
ncbi:uncharacterized protein PFB0145c-like [Actinia tenebrosa]|uniref:Uncharacterized protein PFB0145c-like n=1 Tax=Actinia tenebrosa TaxID=6105 RepID=A0A6P8ITV4_ACTTE|nr:uncharacterized protein PFB0145c-like [Actinia tenebrosa]